ncbi:MAG: DNA adenine methylase [Rhizobiales bacterium]|nr:DNA adenine methylase [Hyphomicrobiales bacterium]
MSTVPVRPAKPFAPYLGGKSKLSNVIIRRIAGIEHDLYAEVFVGMGGVFLRRSLRPKAEVINDYNYEVANVFRVLEHHYLALMKLMKFKLTTRREFERLCKIDPGTLTDLQRAARFIYLQRTAFGGKVSGQSFGVAPSRSARFDITRLGTLLEEVHERLAGVVIECLNFSDFIERYDTETTLFYLDPPYFGGETDYGKGLFCRSDYAKLASQLSALKGNFILSINDRPEIRKVFSQFEFEQHEVTYSVGLKTADKYPELLVYGGNSLTKDRWEAITEKQGGLF